MDSPRKSRFTGAGRGAGQRRFLWRTASFAAACALAVAVQARPPQRVPPPQPIPPGQIVYSGTIYVRVRSATGGPVSSEPTVVLTNSQMDGLVTGLSNRIGTDEWEFKNLQVGADFEIRVGAKGYQPQQKFTHVPAYDDSRIRVDFWMQPTGNGEAQPPAGHFLLAPAAQKQVQQAVHDLKNNKNNSARKHLQKALKLARGDPQVNYLMGLLLMRTEHLDEAKPYLEKAVSIDPGQVSALLALGTIHFQHREYRQAKQVLARAVELAPHSWQAQWMLASACLSATDYKNARLHAELALRDGKKKATRVYLILGEALERLGQNAKAREAFEAFLKRDSRSSGADAARREVARLKRMPAITVPVPEAKPSAEANAPGASLAGTPAGTAPPHAASPPNPLAAGTRAPMRTKPAPVLSRPTPPVDLPPPPNWAPADIDTRQPALVSDAACPLPTVLRRASRNALALVKDLEKFSAEEHYESVEISGGEKVGSPLERQFLYMAFINHIRPGLFEVEELRQPSLRASGLDGHWVGVGAPALALAFHPFFEKDFDWQCAGLGEWKGQRAWVLHFSQNPARPPSPLHVFTIGGNEYPAPLKGLAWVGETNGQVLHLETDLVKPLKQFGVTREHYAIDYRLVRFRTHAVSLWLPDNVNLYIAYRHRYFHSYSEFKDIRLFWVGTGQDVAKPRQRKSNP